MKSFTKITTHIAHYSKKDHHLSLDLSGKTPHNPSLSDIIQNFFKKEIASGKVNCRINRTVDTTSIKLQGLFFWDTIPVQDIAIYIANKNNLIRSIQANLFTFRGNAYTSDLLGIHKSGDTSITGRASVRKNEIYVNYTNAVKCYQQGNNDATIISMIIWYDKLEYSLETYTMLPTEVRDEFGRYNFNLSIKSIPNWIRNECQFKKNDGATDYRKYYYRLLLPVFINDKPIEELYIYIDSKKTKILGIDIFLIDKEEYKKEEIFAILEKTMNQYGNLVFANKENGGYSYLGQFLTVDDNNVITITPVNNCN